MWRRLIFSSLGWSFLSLMATNAAVAAERIYVSYGPFERSISVKALENYARNGEIDEDLAVYAQYVKPEQLERLRPILLERAEISPIAVSQFLYSPQGEILLRRLGEVIQSESRQPGFYAIRAALILAATSPQGITPLNVLQKFPTSGIRINLERSLEIARDVEQTIAQNNQATLAVAQQASLEAVSQSPPRPNPAVNLAAQGSYAWRTQTFTLVDRNRATPLLGQTERTFPVDLYIPLVQSSAPVVVISHGLGSDRGTFQYLAEHLASHGYVVAVPEHPGSNATQLQALLNGTATEAADPSEFINRPLDIKFLLNDLERRSRLDPELAGRADVQNVSVIGQSFGGYTALALAGAPLNFDALQKDCADLSNTLNLSLLLQCRAFSLSLTQYEQLSDPRVKAVVALNPIDSSVFGEEGLSQIQIPVLMLGGNADTVAPALPEQIRPFTWLTTPNRYLVLIEQGTHFSVTGETKQPEPIQIPPQLVGPAPTLARRYVEILSLAFLKTYLSDQAAYRPYLSSAYVQSISQSPLPLYLVQSLTTEQLSQAISLVRR
jgi:predicted dienelactone hydrolase